MSAARAVDDALAREVVLRVDFDLVDEDRIRVSTRFNRRSRVAQPRPGDLVYLLDSSGGGCVGRVERVDGWYLCVRPDWSTWTGDSPRPGAASR